MRYVWAVLGVAALLGAFGCQSNCDAFDCGKCVRSLRMECEGMVRGG